MVSGLSASTDTNGIEKILNQFHQAASKADGATYFGLFAPEGIFLGTDATERWTVAQFKKYAEPHFGKGKGWTYTPKSRNIHVFDSGNTAWFDELLENKKYGLCRGSGVVRKIEGQWKVSQYHLTLPVPNELIDELSKMIQDRRSK